MENFEDNIEKEYHERFHDFEEMPDDASWTKIQERIAPEGGQRPVVFWWNSFRTIGIAAVVLFGLLFGGYYYFSETSTEKIAEIEKNATNKATQNTKKVEQNKVDFQEKIAQSNIEKTIQKVKQNKVDFQEKITQSDIKKTTQKVEQNKVDFQEKIVQSDVGKTTKSASNIKEQLPKIVHLDQKIVSQESDEKVVIVEKSIKNETIIKENASKTVIVPTESIVSNNTKVSDEKINLPVKLSDETPKELTEKQQSDLVINDENKIEKSKIEVLEKTIIFEQEMGYLIPKKVNFPDIEKPINVPVIDAAESDLAFEKIPKSRLVFIPPSEVFANISPMLNYYVFSPNRSDNLLVKNVNSSSERLSFAAQLGVVYPLTKKLDLRAGLNFMAGKSKINYDLTNNNARKVTVIDERNIEVLPTETINTESRNWQYLELQSDLLYAINKTHALTVGVRAGVQTSALKKPIFNGRVGYRISKPITRRVALWVEPSMAISLSSQVSIENLFLYRSTGFALNMGVSLLRNN